MVPPRDGRGSHMWSTSEASFESCSKSPGSTPHCHAWVNSQPLVASASRCGKQPFVSGPRKSRSCLLLPHNAACPDWCEHDPRCLFSSNLVSPPGERIPSSLEAGAWRAGPWCCLVPVFTGALSLAPIRTCTWVLAGHWRVRVPILASQGSQEDGRMEVTPST